MIIQMNEKIINQVKCIVRDCGDYLRNNEIINVKEKNGYQDLVTEKDKEVETLLKNKISKIMPGSTFIGEEGAKELSDSVWIVDPIDGTTNFINSHEMFTVSLAYFEDYKPIFGVVYDVANDVLYWAWKSHGAYINENRFYPTLINKKLHDCIWDSSVNAILNKPKLQKLFIQTRGVRSIGCCSLSVIRVALNKVDFYISDNAKCWDYAGAHVFFEECNGYSFFESDFFAEKENTIVYCFNESLLKEILRYV